MSDELARHLVVVYAGCAGLLALVGAATVCAIARVMALRSVSSERGYRGLL